LSLILSCFIYCVSQVLYALADYEIMQEVVIDSTSAPQYAAWQNNVYGDGREVLLFIDL